MSQVWFIEAWQMCRNHYLFTSRAKVLCLARHQCPAANTVFMLRSNKAARSVTDGLKVPSQPLGLRPGAKFNVGVGRGLQDTRGSFCTYLEHRGQAVAYHYPPCRSNELGLRRSKVDRTREMYIIEFGRHSPLRRSGHRTGALRGVCHVPVKTTFTEQSAPRHGASEVSQ